MHHSKIEIIQIIRGLSALSVAFFHCKSVLTDKDSLKDTIDWLFNSGAAGVDIFFIVSGFIMVYSTHKFDLNGNSNSFSFLIKRIVRVWPPYAIVTILYLIILYKLNTWNDSLPFKLALKSLIFYPIDSRDAPFYGYPLLEVGWSLNYEMYFYIVFAVSLFFRYYRYVFLFAYFLITLCVVPFAINGTVTLDPHQNGQFQSLYLNFVTNPIIWEFAVGIILGLLYTHEGTNNVIRTKSPAFVPYAMLLLAIWQYLSGFWGGHGIINWGLGATLLLFSSLFYFENIKWSSTLVLLGEYSFSLYLIHIPIKAYLVKLFESNNLPVFAHGQSSLLLVVGSSMLFSYISYQLLERKLSAFLLKLFYKKQPISLTFYLRR
jgi:exopolysaccharide production protein ExoZ